MPVLDLGYRNWEGPRTYPWTRWLVVAASGSSLVWRSTWIRRLMMMAVIPALITVAGFYIYEQGLKDEQSRRFIAQTFMRQIQDRQLAQQILRNPAEVRHEVWANLLLWFFRYPQAILMVILVGVIAPRLISYDLRSRGYLLYLSRPLSPAEYLVGKAAVLWFLIGLITTIPALLVYVAGVLFSPDLSVLNETWDLPLRVLAASVVLAVPTSFVAICFSSFTTESRFAGFAWFAIWIVGWVTYAVANGPRAFSNSPYNTTPSLFRFLSPFHLLGSLQSGAFGLVRDPTELYLPVSLCLIVTVLSATIAYRQIAGTLRV